MKFLSEQIKAKLEKEQQLANEKADRERAETNLKDLANKLNDAEAAAQAAQEAADAALAKIASAKKLLYEIIAKKDKRWWQKV